MEAVARMKKAFAFLYQALPDELRRLVAGVPQGYAYGLWSWLEKKYQSTEQDNVGDLWEQFTQLAQEADESFDAYKARVDQTFALLEHAKDKPSPGLYAHRLLWKLCPNYNPVVLALKASGKLKDASKIDWAEVVAFVNNHERSERRLGNADDDGHAKEHSGGLVASAMQRHVRRGGPGNEGRTRESVKCFNCGDEGHIAKGCRRETKDTRRRGEGQDPGNDERDEAGGLQAPRREHGQMASVRWRDESDGNVSDDDVRYAFSARLFSHEEKSGEQHEAATAVQDRPRAVSTSASAGDAPSLTARHSGGFYSTSHTKGPSVGRQPPSEALPGRGEAEHGGRTMQRKRYAGRNQQQEKSGSIGDGIVSIAAERPIGRGSGGAWSPAELGYELPDDDHDWGKDTDQKNDPRDGSW